MATTSSPGCRAQPCLRREGGGCRSDMKWHLGPRDSPPKWGRRLVWVVGPSAPPGCSWCVCPDLCAHHQCKGHSCTRRGVQVALGPVSLDWVRAHVCWMFLGSDFQPGLVQNEIQALCSRITKTFKMAAVEFQTSQGSCVPRGQAWGSGCCPEVTSGPGGLPASHGACLWFPGHLSGALSCLAR